MQTDTRPGRAPENRQIVMTFGPQSGGLENVRFRESGPGSRRHRQVFRITHCAVLAEWITALIAVGLLSFYLFAILETRKPSERDNIEFKVAIAFPHTLSPILYSLCLLSSRLSSLSTNRLDVNALHYCAVFCLLHIR